MRVDQARDGGLRPLPLTSILPRGGLASKPLLCIGKGCAEGRSLFAGGTGVSPVFGFITPFLARACPESFQGRIEGKGDGGMVDTGVERRRRRSKTEVFR